MIPDIDREARRKRRVPVIGFILFGMSVAAALLQRFEPDWQWLAFAVGIAAIAAVGASIDPPVIRRRRIHGRDASFTGHALDAGARPIGTSPHRWRMLVLVSRLMPRSGGRRWLAEAESVLTEITATRRSAAVRSYLRSAPRLAVLMWAHEVLRRTRPGPRRLR